MLLETALSCIARGWAVFPCAPKTKIPLIPKSEGGRGYKDATIDEAQVRAWWTGCPNANVPIATGFSGLCVVDVDHGIKDEAELLTWMEAHGLPKTYAVRTGRRPEYGVQLYYSGEGLKSTGWEKDGLKGDIRCSTGLVMAAGSIHPESGEAYKVLWDLPVVPVPEYVKTLTTKHTTFDAASAVSDELADEWKTWLLEYMDHYQIDAKDHESRVVNGWWIGVVCPWVNEHTTGHGADSSTVLGILDGKIAFNCKHGTCEHNKRNVAAFKAEMVSRRGDYAPEPGADQKVILGSGKKPVEVDESLDAEELPKGPKPVYPVEVWADTVYGEFANACAEGNHVPAKLFIESLRTVVGAVVGDRLRCGNVDGVSPRAFTICIAPAGAGKGTANSRVNMLFVLDELWDGLTRSSESPLIWSDPAEFNWKSRTIGAQVASFSSAPGLQVAITPRKPKKGEAVNPLERWKPIPRIITMAEEVKGLLANFANESTGSGLEGVLCELYDRPSFTTTGTKDRPPSSGKLMYSLLGGITPEDWTAVFSKVGSTGSGFQSRLNIVGTEEARRVGDLHVPDMEPLRRRLMPMIESLERTPLTINASDEARKHLGGWFLRLELPEGISKSRLNIHAWRTSLHLAWLRGHTAITLEDIKHGIACAEYLGKMREWYAPPEGETRAARAQAAIRKVMRSRHRCSVRDLKQATNSKTIAVEDWDKALKSLCNAGEMRVAEERTDKGRTRRVVILLKDLE